MKAAHTIIKVKSATRSKNVPHIKQVKMPQMRAKQEDTTQQRVKEEVSQDPRGEKNPGLIVMLIKAQLPNKETIS